MIPSYLRPERPPFVDVAIVPVSIDTAGPVVDVTLQPIPPRYTVDARLLTDDLDYWVILDREWPGARLPQIFRSEAAAHAYAARLNAGGVE